MRFFSSLIPILLIPIGKFCSKFNQPMSKKEVTKDEKKDPMFNGFSDDYVNPRNIPKAKFIVKTFK